RKAVRRKVRDRGVDPDAARHRLTAFAPPARLALHRQRERKLTWSIAIGRIAGSEIRIHLTFLILLAWIAIAQYLQGGQQAAIDAVLFVIAIFACVVLHELGHAIAARRY